MSNPLIRLATAEDLPVINDIYNHYVLNSTCTYQEEPSTPHEREEWFAGHGAELPVTVAVQDNQTVGWASLSRFHRRSAYRNTIENSVYVRPELHGRGIGSILLADSIERARAARHRTILALIDMDQKASIQLHLKFGFKQAAHLREVGFKFGRWLDVVYLQLML
ncbi:MAG TPA: GNAT family N-acetyltransferase [Tepidisphaeraceae bacterium]|jgi:phosphinothricin acetyltransferase